MSRFQRLALCSISASLIICHAVAIPIQIHSARIEVEGWKSFCACIVLRSLNGSANALAAQQLLLNITGDMNLLDRDKCYSWPAPAYEITSFSDGFGRPMDNLSGSAGVFAPDIYAFCGPSEFTQVCIRRRHNDCEICISAKVQ